MKQAVDPHEKADALVDGPVIGIRSAGGEMGHRLLVNDDRRIRVPHQLVYTAHVVVVMVCQQEVLDLGEFDTRFLEAFAQ